MNDFIRLVLTVGIVILMLPGLIIEPGPISEAAGIGAIAALWGLDDALGGGS